MARVPPCVRMCPQIAYHDGLGTVMCMGETRETIGRMGQPVS
eukprot:CAMPEP_0198529470 /NCGR_PEP_ID=MMETSP1462-20131121/25775_1 /TAXON_ID=1333877 /ORGANISM="Brandtodinium nutriculum, Strain RCC3387" /LENGTH=41 /DNA_ID= /DNA_START= /DNA_END= /DNA_ORIENTATION=